MVLDPRSLSLRQRDALIFIQSHFRRVRAMPTVREVMAGLGLASPRGASFLIEKLIRAGFLSKTPGSHRGLRLVDGIIDPPSQSCRLPLIGRIAAGAPILSSDHIESMLDVDPKLFTPRADWLFRVEGLSMIRVGIFPGDYVGIHESPAPPSGQIVAAAVLDLATSDMRLTLKKLRRRGDQVSLISENDDQERYPPQHFSASKNEILIVGIYGGLLRCARSL